MIGGVVLAVAQGSKHPGSWIGIGLGAVVLGASMVVWALVLFLAHRHAEKHWCPDPEAHVPLPKGTPPPVDSPLLLSVLRQLRGDVRDAIVRLGRANETGKYGRLSDPVFRDKAWKHNRDQLSGLPGTTLLLDALEDAFAHINRINGFMFARNLSGGTIRPGDDLEGALMALRLAEERLDERLGDASHVP